MIIRSERELWVTGTCGIRVSRVVFPSITRLSKCSAISDTISGAKLPKLSQQLHTRGIRAKCAIIREATEQVAEEMREEMLEMIK